MKITIKELKQVIQEEIQRSDITRFETEISEKFNSIMNRHMLNPDPDEVNPIGNELKLWVRTLDEHLNDRFADTLFDEDVGFLLNDIDIQQTSNDTHTIDAKFNIVDFGLDKNERVLGDAQFKAELITEFEEGYLGPHRNKLYDSISVKFNVTKFSINAPQKKSS